MPRARKPAPLRVTHRVTVWRAPDHEETIDASLIGTELRDASGRAIASIDASEHWLWIGPGRIQRGPEVRAVPGPKPARGETSRTYTLRLAPGDVEAFERAAGDESWRTWLAAAGRKAAGIE